MRIVVLSEHRESKDLSVPQVLRDLGLLEFLGSVSYRLP